MFLKLLIKLRYLLLYKCNSYLNVIIKHAKKKVKII